MLWKFHLKSFSNLRQSMAFEHFDIILYWTNSCIHLYNQLNMHFNVRVSLQLDGKKKQNKKKIGHMNYSELLGINLALSSKNVPTGFVYEYL